MKKFVKRFREWLPLKESIDKSEKHLPSFQERELWMTHFGENVGYEMSGKNDHFHRPVIILHKFNKRLFFGIPTSRQIKKDNPFYVEFRYKGKFQSALISQVRVMDAKRLHYIKGKISPKDFGLVKSKFLELFVDKK